MRQVAAISASGLDISAAGIQSALDFTAPHDGTYHDQYEWSALPSAATAVLCTNHLTDGSNNGKGQLNNAPQAARSSGAGTTTGVVGTAWPVRCSAGDKMRAYIAAVASATTAACTRRILEGPIGRGRVVQTISLSAQDLTSAGILSALDFSVPAPGPYQVAYEITSLPSAATTITGSVLLTSSGDARITESVISFLRNTSQTYAGCAGPGGVVGVTTPQFIWASAAGQKIRTYLPAITSANSASITARLIDLSERLPVQYTTIEKVRTPSSTQTDFAVGVGSAGVAGVTTAPASPNKIIPIPKGACAVRILPGGVGSNDGTQDLRVWLTRDIPGGYDAAGAPLASAVEISCYGYAAVTLSTSTGPAAANGGLTSSERLCDAITWTACTASTTPAGSGSTIEANSLAAPSYATSPAANTPAYIQINDLNGASGLIVEHDVGTTTSGFAIVEFLGPASA